MGKLEMNRLHLLLKGFLAREMITFEHLLDLRRQ